MSAAKNIEELKRWRLEKNLDVQSLALLLYEQVQLAYEGAYSEKVCMKTDDGKVEVREVFIAAAMSGTKTIDDILVREELRLEKATTMSEATITISYPDFDPSTIHHE